MVCAFGWDCSGMLFALLLAWCLEKTTLNDGNTLSVVSLWQEWCQVTLSVTARAWWFRRVFIQHRTMMTLSTTGWMSQQEAYQVMPAGPFLRQCQDPLCASSLMKTVEVRQEFLKVALHKSMQFVQVTLLNDGKKRKPPAWSPGRRRTPESCCLILSHGFGKGFQEVGYLHHSHTTFCCESMWSWYT